ncbi:acyltransferase family protein, partial [Streptomyces sp. 4N509B]|uniref:acyltransferase family protein n=1 Tax=Streptomyces sp. 4N509B TaxID=3457413 RepID=UPI003FD05212
MFLAHATLLVSPLDMTSPVSFFADADTATRLADFFAPAGNIGVSFFFVLSGFVLTWSWAPGGRATSFWRRRVLKIYPNHVVVWILAMWLWASSGPVETWLPNLFLVHTFTNDPTVIFSVNHPSWTLCAELLFYALFPAFILLVRRIPERALWLWAGVMAAGVAGMALTTKYLIGGAAIPGLDLTLNQQWFGLYFAPPRLFEFVLGMVLARIVAAGRWPRRVGLAPATALFALGYWAALALPDPYGFSLATIIPVSMIICAAAASDLAATTTPVTGRFGAGWLRSRLMVWLGTVSFAFYMVQAVIIFYGRPEILETRTYATL